MTLTVLVYNEHQLIKHVHTVISVMFLVVSMWLFYRSINGYLKNWDYSRLDKVLSYAFIVNLYLQLIFGFLLMISKASVPVPDMSGHDVTMRMASNRFWPIEHIVLMLFALFIANLGLIFSNNAQANREKFRKVLVYYAIAIILIVLSLGSTFFE